MRRVRLSALTPLQRARRERILTTTRDQLSLLGYDGINMRNLAAAAEVSPTTLYNLYENKDVLVLSALEDQLSRMGKQAGVQPSAGLDYLLTISRAITRQIVETPRWADAIARLLFQAQPEDPITRTLLTDTLKDRQAALTVMQQAGEIDADADPASLSRSLMGAAWSTIMLWTKDVITLEALPAEYLRNQLYVLLAAATPKSRRRLTRELDQLDKGTFNENSG
jgi:AcrR family transcriptional regulator